MCHLGKHRRLDDGNIDDDTGDFEGWDEEFPVLRSQSTIGSFSGILKRLNRSSWLFSTMFFGRALVYLRVV